MNADLLTEAIGGPIAVVLIVAAGRWARRVSQAIDRIHDAVLPPDGPSLRRSVNNLELRVTVLEHSGSTR